MLLPLVGLTAGWPAGWLAGRRNGGRFRNFKNSLQVKLFGFLLRLVLLHCYYSIISMHFNWFFSAKANFKVCIEAQKISVTIFFHVNPYY